MKNLHLIKTDKPSRLFLNKMNNKLLLDSDTYSNLEKILPNSKYQNIYITNDDRPKKYDYFISEKNEIIKSSNDHTICNHKKIILSTDEYLIADRVQSIDDEFLQWFVNNSSCEFVEVKKGFADGSAYGYDFLSYKIIIPQEEPKQETLEEVAEKEYPKLIVENPSCNGYNEPNHIDINEECRNAFMEGIKYMQEQENLRLKHTKALLDNCEKCLEKSIKKEQMFSEEDMIEFGKFCYIDAHSVNRVKTFKELLEQFKNK
jgi:hypothetical protein